VKPPPSLWWSTLDQPVVPRVALERHLDVDVAIVGGGFTGLWTARELKRRDPELRIAVLEKSVCGFGASGRNGGWASALFPISNESIIKRHGVHVFSEQRRLLQNAVGNLGTSIRDDGIDAHYVRGGTLDFARSHVQATRLKSAVEVSRKFGVATGDLEWLEGDALREHGFVNGAIGATFSPHCARIHPARLVRGLSDVVERLGVMIFENTPVVRIVPRRPRHEPEVITVGATVHATYIVRATEAFTTTLPGERRTVAPIYSLVIATEPLPTSFWNQVGFERGETFADDRHLIIYGQRTHDGRIAFGGRGSPYHFGSTIEERFDANTNVFSKLETTLRELFPSLEGSITHRWGGPLAMPRDHWPSVLVDTASGLACAGGYTGDGVTLSHVAATALADLITQPDVETEFTRLPFVRHHSKRWELEPLRWLGVNAGLALANLADRGESRRGEETWAGRLLARLLEN
jgi:glycine/D-amino acid oxidase-like deaminating enzyme